MRTSNILDLRGAMCLAAVLLASNVMAQAPDNAALLYYQAFLLYEGANQVTDKLLADFFRSGEVVSDEAIVQHIERNRRAIEVAVTAADVSMCDWGYDYSRGIKMATPNLAPLRRIVFLLLAEAKWLAEHNNFKAALDRCVTVRKIAVHAGQGTIIPWLCGISINDRADGIIEDILDIMPLDVEELARLKRRLIQTQTRFPSLASCLNQETDMNAAMMHRDTVQPIIDFFEKSLGTPSSARMLKRIHEGDDTFFAKNRDYYRIAMAMLVATLESSLPYSEMCTSLNDLSKHWSQEAEENEDATLTSLWLSVPPYGAMIRQLTHANAIRTAIDLYIAKAQTGHLPDTLPANSSRDLLSGSPFAYSKTSDGFILRCRAKEDPGTGKHVQEYRFKVKRGAGDSGVTHIGSCQE